MVEKFIIEGLGGAKLLSGTVEINGAKNSALKAFAAALLFDGTVELKNVPQTNDIDTVSSILDKLGADVDGNKSVFKIGSGNLKSTDIDPELAGSMRASVVLTGPLLARFGNVTFPAPGGCVIGARPIDLFIEGYKQMGATISLDEKNCLYNIQAPQGLKGTNIAFNKISVGATETLMMAAVLAAGKTTLNNCAREPEIVNIAEWLNQNGADIKGAGTSAIVVEGRAGKLLTPKTPFVTIPDRIVTGSYILLGALCARNLTIRNCRPDHATALVDMLKKSGVPIQTTADTISIANNVKPNSSFKSFDIRTSEYPGFPTDLQSPVVTFLTQASGTSHVTETIFEGRFKYIEELKKLGANIETMSPHEIAVTGPTTFKSLLAGEQLRAHDIRAGFAVTMAALLGKGTSTIDNVQLIDRGYEKLEETLTKLGASVTRSG